MCGIMQMHMMRLHTFIRELVLKRHRSLEMRHHLVGNGLIYTCGCD